MSRRDERLTLRQMLDHAVEAVEMAQGREREDLDQDRQLNLALVRLLEVVGEAATRVSGETRERHAMVAWTEIVGLRNRLIHGYDAVDFDILWQVIQVDLPPLILQLAKILDRGGEG